MPRITKTPGIRKKVLKGSGEAWELRIAKKGFAPLSKCYDSQKAAEAARDQYLARVSEGKSPINRRAEKFRLADAIAEYRTANQKTDPEDPKKLISIIPKGEGYRLDMLEEDIGNWPVQSLKHKAIAGYIDVKGKEPVPEPKNKKKTHYLYAGDRVRIRSGGTVRKLYYTLKKVAQWHAIHHEYTLPDYAFEGQKVPGGWLNERERRLEPGEEEKILAAIDASYTNHAEWRNLILWALESGMRAQELLKTEWKDINLEQRFIRIRKEIVKTKTARQVPLSQKAIQALHGHEVTRRDDNPRIFWQWANSATLGRAFKVIVKNASLGQPLTIHDLRHEATSRLFENTDLSTVEIAAITGHRDVRTLQRYTHLRPELMASKLDGKVSKVEVPANDYMAFLAWKESQADAKPVPG